MPQVLVLEDDQSYLRDLASIKVDSWVVARTVWAELLTTHMSVLGEQAQWFVDFKRASSANYYSRLCVYHPVPVDFLQRTAKVIRTLRQPARALITLRLMEGAR